MFTHISGRTDTQRYYTRINGTLDGISAETREFYRYYYLVSICVRRTV